jgi:hypothetical protein
MQFLINEGRKLPMLGSRKAEMRKLIIALAASASLLSGCTTKQANGWAAVMAASAKAGWDAGTEVTEARNEAEALRTARILAVEQQLAPLHGSATIITPPQPPNWPGQPPSFIYW